MNEDYFIEPVSASFQEDGAAQPHRIYKRQAPEHGAEQGGRPPAPRETCGVQGTVPFLSHFCDEPVAAGSCDSCEAHGGKIKGAGPSLSPPGDATGGWVSDGWELLAGRQPRGPSGAPITVPTGVFITGELVQMASRESRLAEHRAVGLWH